MNREIKTTTGLFIIAIFVGLFWLTFANREAINDWWHFRSYEPSLAIENLAEQAGMSEEGERLFFRADPMIVSQDTIDEACESLENLGCFTGGPKIYILDFNGETELNQAIVTAAHEMLHVAYFRLSDDERAEVDALLEEQLALMSNSNPSKQRILAYEPEIQLDEAHSILGSEVEDLTPELEAYYDQYFSDRSKTLEAFRLSQVLLAVILEVKGVTWS